VAVVGMKRKFFFLRMFQCLFILCTVHYRLQAQQDCVLLPPAVTIDFGSGVINDINIGSLPKYERDFTSCPNDGYYSYASHTSGCFNGDWLTFDGDHTNSGGNMMLVNASVTGGIFF